MTNPIPAQVGDTELVCRAQAGDLDDFEALATCCEQRVYCLASNAREKP